MAVITFQTEHRPRSVRFLLIATSTIDCWGTSGSSFRSVGLEDEALC